MRLTVPTLAFLAMAAGCSPGLSPKAETFEIEGGRLVAKGWVEKGEFHADIRLKDADEHTAMHSVYLLPRGGDAVAPTRWKDKTPRPWRTRLGLGLGLGIPIGSSVAGLGGLGVSVPLTSKGRNRITAVEAHWKLTGSLRPLADCELKVNVAIDQMSQTQVVATLLGLKGASDPPGGGADRNGDEAREIDFVLKK
jgi:hypothetical protein